MTYRALQELRANLDTGQGQDNDHSIFISRLEKQAHQEVFIDMDGQHCVAAEYLGFWC